MVRDPISHKNIKFIYYAKGFALELLRRLGEKRSREKWIKTVYSLDQDVLESRLAYYNRINQSVESPEEGLRIEDLKLPTTNRTYYFDLIEFTRYFSDELKIKYQFGDVTEVPPEPTLVKSRPISSSNENSILFKFNRVRHYTFTNDRVPYNNKENLLIGRANIAQEHRREFMRKYFGHPLCDLGQINSGTGHDEWLKNKISINDHLKYKFIWCQEGYDVASNLKWVMSSNSIAIMPRPKYESWFMEGTLIPNVHYIALKDDLSNLEERLNYYLDHEGEAQEIVRNANAYVQKFKDAKLEKTLCLLVLDKYFSKSGQLKSLFPKWY